MVRDCSISINDLIYPVFVEENISQKEPIESMPGIFRIPECELSQEIIRIEELGIRGVILFGVSHNKDETGSDSLQKNGLLSRMVRIAKTSSKEMLIIADLCFCEYTTHGHCGVLDKHSQVDNDITISNLGKQALIAVKAGADIVAPSAMMDGQVMAIRKALDENGYSQIPIMSYSSKFSSSLYGPFRKAAGTTLSGTRNAYMLDFQNKKQIVHESILDENEGADILMVKPGMFYLDVLSEVRKATSSPICVYNVSGEYSMLKHASDHGILDYYQALNELFISFKRAGADLIISYSALDWAQKFYKPAVKRHR